jgi:carboxyl-terminal processing protease
MLSYTDMNRKQFTRKYKTFDAFNREFHIDAAAIEGLKAAGEKNGVRYDQAQYKVSEPEIMRVMKALVDRDLWNMSEYFMVVNEDDMALRRALEVLNDQVMYETLLGYRRQQ